MATWRIESWRQQCDENKTWRGQPAKALGSGAGAGGQAIGGVKEAKAA
jgi:hypothetical protein